MPEHEKDAEDVAEVTKIAKVQKNAISGECRKTNEQLRIGVERVQAVMTDRKILAETQSEESKHWVLHGLGFLAAFLHNGAAPGQVSAGALHFEIRQDVWHASYQAGFSENLSFSLGDCVIFSSLEFANVAFGNCSQDADVV